MRKKSVLFLLFLLVLGITATASAYEPRGAERVPGVTYWLTILHNNDGESQVINAGAGREDFGGAARFKTVVDDLRRAATRPGGAEPGGRRGVIVISSGDNFLAGPELTVGLENGVPFYDTIAMELIGYDAVALGNHDFDFGPDVLADFIDGYDKAPYYVAANVDFTGEPRLQAYVNARIIRPSIVKFKSGQKIGVIGLETPQLDFVSSPRNVEVSDDLVGAVQAAANRMKRQGVNKIILASHLQDIQNEVELVGKLRDVDVVIAGGGDELLASDGDLLIPGDEGSVYGPYPMMATDRIGRMVPIVTTSGDYKYVGKLVVGFDRQGYVVAVDDGRSMPVRVAGDDCNGTLPCDDAVEPNAEMMARVVEPVQAGLAALDADVIGVSEVALDGTRNNIRGIETNEGNLIADSFLWQATEVAAAFGIKTPDVAFQNGGGIRNNNVIPAGDITTLDTFDMLPFANFLSAVEDVPRDTFKEILENFVACTQPTDAAGNPNCATGRFAQIAGFTMEYSASGTPLILDGTPELNVLQEGTRIINVTLDDGTEIVKDGVVVPGAPITLATNDFSIKGGDQYPFRGLPFTTLGFSYQQALANYIEDGLGGLISAADYPEGGEGRIVVLP